MFHGIRKPTLTRYLDSTFTDAFFESGHLRLSSFATCRQHEDEARGDTQEGWINQTIRTPNSHENILALQAGEVYILCATGTESLAMQNTFKTADGFRIHDPFGFIAAIAEVLPGCFRTVQGTCYYRDSTQLHYHNQNPFPDLASMPEADVIAFMESYIPGIPEDSLFLKNAVYRDQNEYRFIWYAQGVARPTIDVVCPAAIRYCERIPSRD